MSGVAFREGCQVHNKWLTFCCAEHCTKGQHLISVSDEELRRGGFMLRLQLANSRADVCAPLCPIQKTSMLFLFSLWQLFTDEEKALGTGWDTSKQECGLLTPLMEGSHLPTLLWVVSEKETSLLCSSHWVGLAGKFGSGFSAYCCSVPKSGQIL